MNSKAIETFCPENFMQKNSSVKYSTFNHVTYFSKTTNCERGFNIFLPPAYDETKKYPVLYLLHGIFGNEYALCGDKNNYISEILGNFAKQGKEIIVVLPNMFASSDPDLKPSFSDKGTAPYDNFINDLINDLMPFVNANFSTLTGRENTAVAGFSMGGRESLFIGLTRPDLFSYIGAISPAPGLVPAKDWAMTHKGQLQESQLVFTDTKNLPAFLMICCGSSDKTVGQFPRSYHRIFTLNNVDHIWYEMPDTDHNSTAIRSGFYNFVNNIFE